MDTDSVVVCPVPPLFQAPTVASCSIGPSAGTIS
jgi:hypothetical protein